MILRECAGRGKMCRSFCRDFEQKCSGNRGSESAPVAGPPATEPPNADQFCTKSLQNAPHIFPRPAHSRKITDPPPLTRTLCTRPAHHIPDPHMWTCSLPPPGGSLTPPGIWGVTDPPPHGRTLTQCAGQGPGAARADGFFRWEGWRIGQF
jgi:hypothetical protein